MNTSKPEQIDEAFAVLMRSYEEKAFTQFDRETCSPVALRDIRFLLRKRLLKEPLPTVAEVEGIKEIALDYLHRDSRRPELPYAKGQYRRSITMILKINPKGTPLPDNHPFKGGVIIFGGVKPVPPTCAEVAWVEQFFEAGHGRKPTGTEAMALIIERRRKGERQ